MALRHGLSLDAYTQNGAQKLSAQNSYQNEWVQKYNAQNITIKM
jgi:hypothetical protein